jgi:hypothetical protein
LYLFLRNFLSTKRSDKTGYNTHPKGKSQDPNPKTQINSIKAISNTQTWEIGNWKMRFIWDLVLEIWDLI